jgi:type I restriction enzyme M protein
MGSFADKVNFIWSVADLIRDHFKRGKYQDVILPFTVLRRIDCVLGPTRAKVREVNAKLQARGLQNRDPQLRKASGYAFYNTSLYDFDSLLGDAPHLAANLRNYLAGFSTNMREVTVERPLRLRFQASPERLGRLRENTTFQGLATSKKRDPRARAAEEAEGRAEQDAILEMLATLPETVYRDRDDFEDALTRAAKAAGIKLKAPVTKAILGALSERDEDAAICLDRDGNPDLDPDLRDTENVPLAESVDMYFDREVRPHVADAWINTAVRDPKDGQVGKVGYEVNFNRYFYTFQPPRPLEEIEADIRTVEKEILEMLGGS